MIAGNSYLTPSPVVVTLDIATWRPAIEPVDTERYARELEAGGVLVLPGLAFRLSDDEARFLDVRWSDGKAKNISLDGDAIKGAQGSAADLAAIARMIARFAADATAPVLGCTDFLARMHRKPPHVTSWAAGCWRTLRASRCGRPTV